VAFGYVQGLDNFEEERAARRPDWFFGQRLARPASNHSVLGLHLNIALPKFDP
jgi:hypothetical protein